MLTELVAQGGLGVIWRGELITPELISLNGKDKYCAVKIVVCKSSPYLIYHIFFPLICIGLAEN
jgi:hypothetical protein